jgi:hypothetical protein
MTATAAPITAEDIPAACGLPGNLDRGGDLNSDWTCRRAAQIYRKYTTLKDIQRTEARLVRLTSDWKRRNLTVWIADAYERLAADLRWLDSDDAPKCGH